MLLVITYPVYHMLPNRTIIGIFNVSRLECPLCM
uniref:Uncharacterized protein n=1 Tax=Arundo donax TaxID=35708 RepID=A0A0A9CWK8_ARUDO